MASRTAFGVTLTLDSSALEAALAAAPAIVLRHVLDACKTTADAVLAEARARASRSFVSRTGATMAGLQVVPNTVGNGWLVIDDDRASRNVPLWLEKGTHTRHTDTVHVQARHFFYSAADAEAGAHRDRVRQAIQDGLDEAGLGGPL